MEINLDGRVLTVDENTRLVTVLEAHDLLTSAVAVVINRKVVPISDWQKRILQPGDHVEALLPVGAG